ncbi:carboxypeptidase regulatory-like domain-containing protein, partial [bacterium]|nr:carboxypeptidase regulatory-like domain-containing protein [bacterium]
VLPRGASSDGDERIVVARGSGRLALRPGNWRSFDARGLPAGRYVVAAWARASDGRRLAGSAALECAAGKRTRVRLALAPAASVAGRVLDPAGKPCASVTLRLSSADSPCDEPAVTDGDGRFSFADVLPGDYLLEARPESLLVVAAKNGARCATAAPVAVHVLAGERRELVFRVGKE